MSGEDSRITSDEEVREEARVVDTMVHAPMVPTVTVETNPRSTVVERTA